MVDQLSSRIADMTTRVAVFGTESTGKTTLARRLAALFDAPWVPEYVRDFWDAHDGDIRAADLASIAIGQIDYEEQAAARAQEVIICDTELLTNALWADLLFPGRCPAWVREAAERRSRHYALYLLCDTDVAFVDDNQRCFPGAVERESCRKLWRETLIKRGLPFIDIRGTLDERIATAARAIQRATGILPAASTI